MNDGVDHTKPAERLFPPPLRQSVASSKVDSEFKAHGRIPILKREHWKSAANAISAATELWTSFADGDVDTKGFAAQLDATAAAAARADAELAIIVSEHKNPTHLPQLRQKATTSLPKKNVEIFPKKSDAPSLMKDFSPEQRKAAEQWGVPVEELDILVRTTRTDPTAVKQEVTQTALPVHASTKMTLTSEDVEKAKNKARLNGLELTHQRRLAAISLPTHGFTTIDEYNAAVSLSSNFQQIQNLQKKIGIEVTPTHEIVKEARRLMAVYYRAHLEQKKSSTPLMSQRGRRQKKCMHLGQPQLRLP